MSSVAVPCSEEAETALLSAMLQDAGAARHAAELVAPEAFYGEVNRRTFRAIAQLLSRGTVPDPVILHDELKRTGELEKVGGAPYLARLVDAVPHAGNVDSYVGILRDKLRLRRLIAAGETLIADAGSDREDAAERAAERIAEIARTNGQARTGADVLARTLADLLADPRTSERPRVVVPRLAWSERVSMLAAREKAGKSTLASAAAGAVSRGEMFLNEDTTAGRVLWVAEEHMGDLADRLNHFGAVGEEVFVLDLHVVDRALDDLAREAARLRPVLIVVDTLASLVARLGLDPGNSSAWTPIMGRLTRVAREAGAAILLLHHARKSDGRYRDSSAIGASVDVILEMDEGDGGPVRKIRGRGRFRVEDFAVQLLDDRYRLTEGEQTIESRVFAYIESNPECSLRKLRGGVSGRAVAVDDAIEALLADGKIIDSGAGNRRAFEKAGTRSGTRPVSSGNPVDMRADTGSGHGRVPISKPIYHDGTRPPDDRLDEGGGKALAAELEQDAGAP